jgi:hypothetical protein
MMTSQVRWFKDDLDADLSSARQEARADNGNGTAESQAILACFGTIVLGKADGRGRPLHGGRARGKPRLFNVSRTAVSRQ